MFSRFFSVFSVSSVVNAVFKMTASSTLPDYAELHCLSNFSFLRGASHAEELVARAKELG